MKNRDAQSKLIENRVLVVTSMIVFIIIAVLYVYNHGMQVADFSANEFYDFYFNEKSEEVKTEVETHLASIQYEWELVSDLGLSKIKHEIRHLSDIMVKSYLIDITDQAMRMEETVRYYEEIIEYDDEHLYFLIDTEGNLLRSGTDNTINGINLMDTQDVNGKFFTRDILKSVEKPEGIFTSYFWPKVANGEPKEKISFCYYIPELNVVVGTGVYLEDIFVDVQENVYRRLNEYYREKENYVFIYSNDGEIMVGPTPESIGTDAKTIMSSDGRSVHEIFSSFLQKETQGFVNYEFTKKGGTEVLEKVSYISKIDGWDVYIGMGFYTEDINLIYNDFEVVSKNLHLNEIRNLAVLLLVLLLIIVFLNIKSRNIQHRIFKNEESTYRVLFDQISDGVIVMVAGEIVFFNPKAKEFLGPNINRYISNGELIFKKNPDGMIQCDADDISYYLEVVAKKIHFKGNEGLLYRLKNISKPYEELKQYKHLSNIDELTGLPNRRRLKYDCDNLKKSGNCNKIIGIIDLDNFKRVNDEHGHDIGDQVLVELAKVFQQRLRKEDGFYRYGGEEFVVMINTISLDVAADLLMEINGLFNDEMKNKFGFSQTFSAGIVATHELANPDVDEVFKKADELLYRAKSNGRNQVQY